MIPEVIIGSNDTRYIIGNDDKSKSPKPLGSGATGDVYAGAHKDSPQRQVAIKIPHPGLSLSTLEDFRAEVATLKKIYDRCGEIKYVPWAELGKDPAQPNLPIVILELVPKDWELTRVARDKKFGEALLLETGVQYAELLVILHDQLQMAMFGDRKHGDTHWDAPHKRLIVLDWNRARDLPNDEQSAEIQHQDIRIFAKLWTELVLRDAIPDMLDPLNKFSPQWENLSLGTRTILARAYSQREDWRFKEAKELRDALKEHCANFQTAQDNPSQLLGDVKSLQATIKKEHAPDVRARQLDHLLIVADLIENHSKGDKESAREITKWAREQIEKSRADVAKKADRIYETLAKGYWGDAYKLARNEIEPLRGKSGEEQKAFLPIHRWFCLSQFADTAFQAHFAENEHISKARAKTLKEFSFWESQDAANIDNLERIRHEFEILPGVPSDLAKLLQPIALEAQIRRLVIQAVQERGKNDKSANKILDEAWSVWNDLNAADPAYAEALLATLAELAEHKKQNSNQEIRAKLLTDQLEQFRRLVDQVTHKLGAPSLAWDEIGQVAKTAILIYSHYLENPIAPIESNELDDQALKQDMDNYEWLVGVQCICNEIRDDADSALKRALEFDSRAPIRDVLVNACAMVAIERLGKIVKEGKWPHELRRGQRLWKLLYQVETQGKQIVGWSDAKDAATGWFVQWEPALIYFIEKLGVRSLGDLDDSELDAELAKWENKIEIFDEWELATDHADQPRLLSQILAVRRAERVKRELAKLPNQVQKLVTGIQNDLTQLTDEIARWDEALGKINIARLVVPDDDFQSELKRMQAVANELEQESKRLPSLKNWWEDQQDTLQKAQSKLSVWHQVRPEIETAVSQINSSIEKLTGEQSVIAHEEATAIGANVKRREEFIAAAKTLFKPESLDALEERINKELGGHPDLSPRHLEAVATWTGYLNEARRLKRRLDTNTGRRNMQKLREDLETLPEDYSDPVFAVFFDIFVECSKKLGNDAEELNSRAEHKVARGNKLLGRLNVGRTSENSQDSVGSENSSLAAEPPQE